MSDRDDVVLPLAAETVSVSRRTVTTGRVTVATRTTTSDVPVDEVLASERVEIERIPVRRFVDEAPSIRTEGDDVIVPVVEEVVVTRLFLKEEVRLRRVRTTRRHRGTVTLREQDAVITREPLAATDEQERRSGAEGARNAE